MKFTKKLATEALCGRPVTFDQNHETLRATRGPIVFARAIEPAPEHAIELPRGWGRAWSHALAHACTDPMRPHLCAIRITPGALYASDGHRIVRAPRATGLDVAVLPCGAHVLDRSTGPLVRFWTGDALAHFQACGMRLSVPLVPDALTEKHLCAVIPLDEPTTLLHASRKAWLDALIEAPSMLGVRIEPVVNACDLRAIGTGPWVVGTTLPATIVRSSGSIQVELRYLCDAIDAMPSDEISIAWFGPLDPIVVGLRADKGEGPIVVVMPQRP